MTISSDYFNVNWKELVEAVAQSSGATEAAAAITPIADPGTATAADVANKVNELITALSGS